VPGADLAVAVHAGPYAELDRTYGALGAHIAERGIGAAGPIREYYIVTPGDSPCPGDLRTEVCWPVDR
jgi:effector-binding domain-containing protein